MKTIIQQHKRIAIIRPDGNPIPKGFYNSQEIGLAKGLSKLGYNVDIFMSGHTQHTKISNIPTINNCTINIYEMPFFLIPEISQAIYPGLLKIISKKKYSLIQVNEENEITSYLVARYAKKNNVPCIVYQGMYKQISGRIRAAFQSIYDRLFLLKFQNNISLAFTKTTRAKKHLEKKGFKNPIVMPIGLDTSAFETSIYRDWHKEYSIPHNARILLYIGVFEDRRNIGFLADIAKELASENYYLLLAGNGPTYQQVEQKLKGENVTNVILLGQVEQKYLKSLYETSDFFLLASNYEIYGMVVLESLYFGCPVISSKTAGPEDLIRDGENGLILDSLDKHMWANKIQTYHQSFNRESIKKHVRENLTWDTIAKRYIDAAFTNSKKP